MPTDDAKLEALRKREAEIKAKIADAEARRRKREEKETERLKTLIGAAVLADSEKNPETKTAVLAAVQRCIEAPKERDFLKAKGWL